jgi:hypothetical protein
MTAKTDSEGRILSNLWAQLGLLAVATVIVIVLAWRYVW